ncbi:MAG TPA: chloride channel protein [Stellaceae bacterium]|nr:chloride channel protein [Stellaceae bacterium]
MAVETEPHKAPRPAGSRLGGRLRWFASWHAMQFTLRLRWRALLRALDRQHLRSNEVAITLVSGILGFVIGIGVVLVREGMQFLHEINFAMPSDRLLSEGIGLMGWRVVLVPSVGGLVVGLTTLMIRRVRPREPVDAIEANALYGGKMSLIDSLNLTLLTLLSGGCGASVGLEAAYTQLGSSFASNFGEILRLRRHDLRTLVGCGAAAAIAAAFNAPMAGAFYAFELIIGSYSTAVLAPVTVAALAGTFAVRWTLGSEPLFFVSEAMEIHGRDYAFFALLGVAAAGLGIVTMVSVTWMEKFIRRYSIPVWARPMLGGLIVGVIAFFRPQVLGSGHGAIQEVIGGEIPLAILILLIPAKALASAMSVGSGFRGGLFSSSLFLGAVFGSAAGGLVQHLLPAHPVDQLAYTLVGMGTVAAAIVGAPVTMILLILELTANFYASVGVMIGVIVASIIVRTCFGYSFATWRFHVRGVPIRGAADIGWIQDLTAGKLMRRDIHTVAATLPLSALRAQFPLGGTKRAFLLDQDGNYAGMILTADAHNPDLGEKLSNLTAGDLKLGASEFLLPYQSIRTALDRFAKTELEALPVLAAAEDHKILGFVTEAYALRRYSQELERARAADLSDPTLFGPA